MKLKQYFHIFKARFRMILGLFIGFIGLALIFSLVMPQTYQANLSIFIEKAQAQKTKEFKYDQYYAIKAQKKLGKFIKHYLNSPEVAADIFKKSKVRSIDYSNPRQLRNKIRTYPVSPQEVKVIFSLQNPNKIEPVSKQIQQKLQHRLQKIYPEKTGTQYEIAKTQALISKGGPYLILNLIIGGLLGLSFGLFAALFQHYLKQ